MGLDHTNKHCKTCKRSVLAQRPGTNHILHLILSIVTGGIWLIIWFMSAVKIGGWRCSHCGGKV